MFKKNTFAWYISEGYFNLSEWKAPISPNFHKISRILEGSYLSEFQNEGGSNLSKFSKYKALWPIFLHFQL